jgi:hypothetical protein
MVVVVMVVAPVWLAVIVFVVAMCRVAASDDAARGSGGSGQAGKKLERRFVGETDRRSGQRGGPPPSSKRGQRGAKAFLSRCLRVPAAQAR